MKKLMTTLISWVAVVGVLTWGHAAFAGPFLTYSYEGNPFTSISGPAFSADSSLIGGVTLEFLGAGKYDSGDEISDWAWGVTRTPSGPFLIQDTTPGLVQSSVSITLDDAGNVVLWSVTVRAPVPPGGPDLHISTTTSSTRDIAIANIGTPELSSGDNFRDQGMWTIVAPDLNDPELPDSIGVCDDATCFDFRNVFSGRWFDPTPATHYTYLAERGTLFTGVELPPHFGDNFMLSASGCNFAASYSSLTFIDLVDACGAALPSFTVSGISPPADGDDPLGFPTRLTFNNLIGSFSMFGSQNAPVTHVDIDIKPTKEPNAINPTSGQKIPVAILTTESFDATQVDWDTVLFGPDGAAKSHAMGHVKDVDDDGDLDLLLHFNTQDTGIQCGDTQATLTGELFSDGGPITGTDSITTVPCL